MYGLEKSYQNSKSVLLDPNHSHFILIDDDSHGELGHDIPFRIKFETELRKDSKSNNELRDRYGEKLSIRTQPRSSSPSHTSLNVDLDEKSGIHDNDSHFVNEKFNIPMILICVNGGYDALTLIHESLKQRVPILVLAVRLDIAFYSSF
jgi:hypothetical protein